MASFVIDVPKIPALPVAGIDALFPVRRVYCIGRNYAAHAVEMGHDPSKEPPFFFQKNPDNLDASCTFPYPGKTQDVHHEVELAVVLKSGGSGIAVADALSHVYGYAVALDMTRRDLQAAAKDMGRPWDTAKAFEHSAPIGPVVPASVCGHPQAGAITLSVNGTLRQSGDLNQMIWKIPEMIAYLSDYFTLAAGDVILTGTPSGVGPVVRGDRLEASVEGFAPLTADVV
ncbi:2-keto-4-pentenoate hydratase/2-oxohepta-3-ene-1,7-dioic acid hydratase (catechol pathway) [Pannonibacter phragmitetus]|uniref:2-keto-4-pentenoate hydratase/2-oxohepta-3-ene-1,7-dioic acid hydratase (Catechol pathway) n=1 Tax=Pannonibacter phragmitetus TaxID=121719 RepID=A0A378ZYU2_9HYPH|nr:fumarylacetoacetate hydrolase family protein [Pannonibacter phragmitetus]SUB02029.1 2-keto-4-pentenoate hydratase/2-oxohepta-3-ene-1,7-dioic acid hydratase (catechol pathway) [Pannonibacter phragmitetus]